MLKRYQVLLPDWLEDYIRYMADKYNLSFSEVIRAEICTSTIYKIAKLYPYYKLGIMPKEILDMGKKDDQKNMEGDEGHRMLSKLYFETRKAIEYRFNEEKKRKKK